MADDPAEHELVTIVPADRCRAQNVRTAVGQHLDQVRRQRDGSHVGRHRSRRLLCMLRRAKLMIVDTVIGLSGMGL